MKILISGASGLIGNALTRLLSEKGHEVWHLVRIKPEPGQKKIFWDPYNNFINKPDLEGLDAIINLSGENIAKRWTAKVKKELRDSRIKTTSLLAKTINELKNPPKVFISASAIGYYGNRGDEDLTESSAAGTGFLPELSKEWEDTATSAKNCRVVLLRTGIVISKDGGALKKMLLPFKLGLGGKIGDGKQYMSWISIEDEVRAIEFCLENENISGPVNLTAPNPVTNEDFTKTLAGILKRPAVFPLPHLMGKLLFGEMADDLLFGGAKIFPARLTEYNFEFAFGDLSSAISYCLKNP